MAREGAQAGFHARLGPGGHVAQMLVGAGAGVYQAAYVTMTPGIALPAPG